MHVAAGEWALEKALKRQDVDLYAIVAPLKAAVEKAGKEAAEKARRAASGAPARPAPKRFVEEKPRRGGRLLSVRFGIHDESQAA